MKISVKAKAGAKNQSISKIGENQFKISVKDPAKEGRANEAIKRVLADYFGVSYSRVRLVHGQTSKDKIFEVF